jgi:hypothetical protein
LGPPIEGINEMASIKPLCVALLAMALVAAACGGAGDQDQGESTKPEQQAQGESSKKDKERKPKKDKPEAHESPTPEGNVVRVRVAGGSVQGVEDTVDLAVGEKLTILVRSDTADEVHVHGYNLFDDVGPKQQAKIELTADIPGVFEVELEDAHLLLFELQVQ